MAQGKTVRSLLSRMNPLCLDFEDLQNGALPGSTCARQRRMVFQVVSYSIWSILFYLTVGNSACQPQVRDTPLHDFVNFRRSPCPVLYIVAIHRQISRTLVCNHL
jgi:hypothetical protein